MKKSNLILVFLIITILIFTAFLTLNRRTHEIVRLEDSKLNPVNCINHNLNAIADTVNIQTLFPDYMWKKVATSSIMERGLNSGYTEFRRFSDENYVLINNLPGAAWSVYFDYGTPPDYSIDGKFSSNYLDKFLKIGWEGEAYANGFEIKGIAADSPTSGTHGLVKIKDGKLLVAVIDRAGSYKGNFPDDAELTATTYTVFLSDPIPLSELLPGYQPGVYLGVMHAIITPEIQGQKNLPVDYGALVTSDGSLESPVKKGSPAEKAGLIDGDIILNVDDQRIDEHTPLNVLLQKHVVCDIVKLKVLTHGKEREVSVTLVGY